VITLPLSVRNRKVLIFSIEELPEMGRGKGVRLQKYKDGGLSDATTFNLEEGLSWLDPAGRHAHRKRSGRMDRKTGKRGAHGATRLPTGQQIHKLKIKTHAQNISCLSMRFLNPACARQGAHNLMMPTRGLSTGP
jgi:DNA gyrase/topoisomerase IV subunit A